MDANQLLNDTETALRLMMDGRQAGIWSAMPGIVKAVDLVAMTLSVQPAIRSTITDEDGNVIAVDLPLLVDVPVVFPSAGGYSITFPIAVGDEVLVVFASRCIDSWWQSGGFQNVPMEARMHDLSDGFAIPGPRSKPRVLGGISATALQIRKDDGSKFIEIAAGGINITGNVNVTGSIITSGDVTSSGDVVASGKSLKTHIHPVSVPATPFTGNTGAPV